jgi:two-component system NarL family sensor kinase
VIRLALDLAVLLPALSMMAGAVALLNTSSRMSGVFLGITAAAMIASVVLRLADRPDVAFTVLMGSVLVPGALAVLAYPSPRVDRAFEFCLWVVVVAAGALATTLTLSGDIDHLGTAGTFAILSVLGLIGHAWFVLETGDEADREAMLWLALAVCITGLFIGLLPIPFGVRGAALGAVPAAMIGPAMAIGVRRPRLVDVRALVVDVVVFAVVAFSYLSVFVGAVAAFEAGGVDEPSPVFFAFLGLALAFGVHPLRVVLRGLIDELFFGDRPDPLAAATAVTGRMGDDPVLALRAIREALALPFASISSGGIELAASGTAVTDTRRLPLLPGDDTAGEIVVGLRAGELKLSADDEQVLRIVGPLLAQTLRARSLARDLQESRSAAIFAIEEERRRLRRDLHDGLGPTLSGIAHTAAAARNTLASDPHTADALLEGVRSNAAGAVAEIRRLVYDMRPPALDELGLEGALRQQVDTVRTPSGRPMNVVVEVDELPALTASVEVAAYRIAMEAVTNSARHSGGDRAWLRLDHDCDQLIVSVRDTGSSSGEWTPGVGMASMRERAAEVGGHLEVSTNGHGSLVRASLPLISTSPR